MSIQGIAMEFGGLSQTFMGFDGTAMAQPWAFVVPTTNGNALKAFRESSAVESLMAM